VTDARVDMTQVVSRKRKMVEGLVAMQVDAFRTNGAELILGQAHFVGPKAVEVALNDGGTRLLSGDRVFLDLLAKIQAEGRDVSHKHSSGFAPTVFAQHPDRSGLSKKVLEDAMNRLFGAKKIRVERVGPPSRQHSRIIVVETDTSEESNGDEL